MRVIYKFITDSGSRVAPEDFKFLSEPDGGLAHSIQRLMFRALEQQVAAVGLSGDPSTGVLVPEPVTMILLGLGLLGVGIAVRKRS